MSDHDELEQYDIIQFPPDRAINPRFHGMLGIVNEVKPWGAMVYVRLFEEDGMTHCVWYRLPKEHVIKVGELAFIPEQEGETS